MFHGLASMFSKNEKTLSHCPMKAPSRDCINGYLGMKQPKQEAQSITSQAVRKKKLYRFLFTGEHHLQLHLLRAFTAQWSVPVKLTSLHALLAFAVEPVE